jgi:release factor glutamine methyltransferase
MNMDSRTALKTGIAQLREASVPSYTLAAELLLLHAAGRDRTWLYAYPEEHLPEENVNRYFALIDRRASGEPTQYLTGKQEFWGLEFEVTPAALIPRPETEHVIEVALDRLALREIRAGRPQKAIGENLQIADIGTGSGCIVIALAKELPKAKFVATDISRAALEVGRRNATRLGVADRIEFIESNLLDKTRVIRPELAGARHAARQLGTIASMEAPHPVSHGLVNPSPIPSHQSPVFDLIVSNPPYIGRREAPTLAREVLDHEPHEALFGGEQGSELYGALVAQSAKNLKPGGILVLELGHDSLPAVGPLLDSPQWTRVGVTNDLAGIPRVIAAEKLERDPSAT